MSEPGASNRRYKVRVRVYFQTEYSGRRTRGSGIILNISEGGALIGDAEPLLVAGGRIRLRFSFFEDSLPVEIPATVVRETPDGFAVQFAGLDARLKSLLTVAIAKAKRRLQELEDEGIEDEEEKTLLSLIE